MVAAQSWQRVQGINFGPVNDELRRYRIAFYPLNPDTLVNRIDNLIAGTDVLTASFLANKTADIQGLSALEKILFQALAFETVSAAPTSERYCSLLAAITSNLHNISMVVSNQWQSGGDYYSQFVLEENNEQSLESWFGSVAEHLEIIKNAKLLQVAIGSSADIETPLAQTSIDNIKNNFQYFLDAFYMNDESGVDYLLESVQGGVELLDLTTQADVLTALLSANTQSLVELSQSDAGVEDIEALGQAVHELLESFAIDVAGAVDVYIGFNGADGD